MSESEEKNNLAWHIVEKGISKEIDWLRRVIDFTDTTGQMSVEPDAIKKWSSEYYLYRLLAILIVSGQIKATEISSSFLWGDNDNNFEKIHKHGKEWHNNMMNIIDNYFKMQGYDITTEPQLHHGRADLGVFKKDKKDMYVEVGTTSIYKLCLNLYFMKDFVILIVPKNNKLIEFVK